jgi:predicted nucleic acid-binding protein
VIVVDSSVWIDSLRNRESRAVFTLKQLTQTGSVLVGDLILLEVLQGADNDRHALFLERYLRQFAMAEMLGADLAVKAAAHFRALRRRGITIRKTNDMIIGTFCIENGHVLLQQDRDFLPMAEHLGLKLA